MNSRRNFIKTIILSTGAVFLSWKDLRSAQIKRLQKGNSIAISTNSLHFRNAHEVLRDHKSAPSFPYHPQKIVDTVIIGGGAAGMAAAWRLKKSGKDCMLLENEPEIGGVMQNPINSWNGIPYPLGSTYFYRYNGEYREFYNDIGFHPIETGEDALYFDKDSIVVDWWNPKNMGTLPLPQKDVDAFRTFRDFLLAFPVPQYPLSSASKKEIEKYDSISAYEYVKRFGSEKLIDVMDMYSLSVLGAPLKEVNAYSLLNFYSLEFGDSYQIPCYTAGGGLGAIAENATQFIGKDHIKTNALAINVENKDKKVIVNYIDAITGETHTVKASKAIVAAQKQIAKTIVKGMPNDQIQAINEIRYAPYITIALCCNAPLFGKRAFDFWISDKRRRFTDIIDVTSSEDAATTPTHSLARRGKNSFVYMLSSARPESERKHLENEKWLAQFAQETAAALNEHIPGAQEKIEEMRVFAWGHSMVIPSVGSYQKLASVISKPVGNIYFANSDSDLAPGIENALEWGFETASRRGG